MIEIISPNQAIRTQWKNGLGLTSQILIHPAHASLEASDFLWRLSSATVFKPSPFSKFPGFDRLLTIISGAGLMLHNQSTQSITQLSGDEVIHFSGSDLIEAKPLKEKPVVDLGLIFNFERVQARMLRFELMPDQILSRLTDSACEEHLLFVSQGEMTIAEPGISITSENSGTSTCVSLTAGFCAKLKSDTTYQLKSISNTNSELVQILINYI